MAAKEPETAPLAGIFGIGFCQETRVWTDLCHLKEPEEDAMSAKADPGPAVCVNVEL